MTRRLSLRLRLLIATGVVSLVALGIADAVVYGSLSSYLYNQVDGTLEASHQAVEALASNPGGSPPAEAPGGPGPGGSAFCDVGRESAPGMFIEVLTSKGTAATGADGTEECPAFQPGSVTYSPHLPKVITGYRNTTPGRYEPTVYFTVPSVGASGPSFRVRASRLDNGDVLVVAAPIGNVTDTLGQLVLVELLVTLGALAAAVGLGFWLVRVGLKPLRAVEQTAQAIAGGDLEHRVPDASDRTEVGHLAGALNVMLERIERLVSDLRASEARLRRFVGDASHELRTPIAAVSAYAQLFDKGAASRPEDLERVMAGIEHESARMAGLVEDLLTLARLDEHQPLETEPVELVGLVMEAIGTAQLVGPEWPVSFEADDAVEVAGSASALRRVVDNLLSNVRAHTPAGTPATVRVGRAGGEATVEVADEGPGMTGEDADRVFERFFRADASRTRSTGGAGLGLAIVVSIVEAHGGRVEAVAGPGGTGAAFRVTVPALPAPAPAE